MGGKKTDFTGLKLGHLTVIEPTGRHDGNGRAIWRCDCDCGNTIYLDSRALKRTKRRDCGCIPDAAPPRSGIRWAAASPEATFPSMSRASGAAEAGEHPAGSLRRPSRQTGGHAGAYGVFRVSARSALRSLPRMAHEDTQKAKGKQRKDALFKRPVAWMPLDADPE